LRHPKTGFDPHFRVPRPDATGAVTGGLLVGVTASSLAFHGGGFWVDFVLPLLTMCLMGLITETLARRRLRDSFGRYVSREVMAQVLVDAPGLAGERREVSILFSDLRGFTALAESRPAERVAAHLSEYFATMTTAIFAHRGTINDFVGDAVMAIFGAPLTDPQHALHAARSAVAMQEALVGLNRRWEAAGLPTLRMGIGIHSGEVFAGNVGGAEHLKYAVVGDPVNVAARLEGLNKDLGTTVLMTEATRGILGDRVEAKDCGTLWVKGRTQPLRVYELLALRPESEGGSPCAGRSS
jgi:adenylate cyclase